MDKSKFEIATTFESEEIPDKDYVFRRCFKKNSIKTKERRYPNEACFKLRPQINEKGLSVNWEKYIDERGVFCLMGLTKKGDGKYVQYDTFFLVKLSVGYLRSLKESVINVIHTPIFSGNPSNDGEPNDKSHAEILLKNDDEEFRLKLADYCQKTEGAICQFDTKQLDDEIDSLRKRLNETPFHTYEWAIDNN